MMGGVGAVGGSGGDKNHHHHHLNFHFPLPYILHHRHHQIHHHHHHHNQQVPKGFVAVMVGQGEEQQRFLVPVIYVNHPLFMQLLKEAEEEYGFHHEGPINIPCHVEEFRQVQGMIDQEKSHHHHHNNHHHHAWCFKA